jgi:hypothetical protein
MRPRSMVLPDSVLAPKQRGLASRFARATVFFLVGAISATELYPQMVVGRHAEDNRTFERTAARSATPDVTWDQTAAFLRDSAENTGGPIPPVSFAAQPAPAAKEAQSPADEAASVAAEKSRRRVEAKFARTKRSSPRRNGSAYQQEPSYWVTGRGSFASGGPQFGSDFGPRQSHGTQFDRRGPFAMWR